MSRNVLIGLAIATVVLLAGAFAWRFTAAQRGQEGSAGIVIVTNNTLDQIAEHNLIRRLERRTPQNAGSTAQSGVQQLAADSSGAAESAAGQGEPASNGPANATLIRNLFADRLEAIIGGLLTDSRRFQVADPTSLQPILRRLSENTPQQQAPDQRDQTLMQRGMEQISETMNGTRVDSVTMTDPAQNADLASAARGLGVQYLLSVTLESPEYTYTENNERLRIEFDPLYVYRLYVLTDRGGRALFTGVARAPQPVVVEITAEDAYAEQNGAVAHVLRAWSEAGLELQNTIAREVAQRVLDKVYPAGIVDDDPVRISRGASDGVQQGDTYEIVYRELSDPQRDSGVTIGYPETVVGVATVTAVQDNMATISPASGVIIDRAKLNHYIVRRPEQADGGQPGSYAGSPGAGLGVDDIAARERAGAEGQITASVAIGELRIRSDVDNIDLRVGTLEGAISGRLARDQRIVVLGRQALDQLRQEHSVGGGRRSYLTSGGNVAQAGYLVVGDVAITTERTAQTVRVAGAPPRETSVQHYLAARGNLRIEALDSRIIGSFEVSARAPIASRAAASTPEASRALSEAFAAAAAQQILPRLFPIEVAAIDGSAIILNRGEDIGLRTGDTLTMYRIGAPIIDPRTQRQISAGARTQVGQVRIVDVQPTIATATAIGNYAAQPEHVAERGGATSAASSSRRASAPETEPVKEADVPW